MCIRDRLVCVCAILNAPHATVDSRVCLLTMTRYLVVIGAMYRITYEECKVYCVLRSGILWVVLDSRSVPKISRYCQFTHLDW